MSERPSRDAVQLASQLLKLRDGARRCSSCVSLDDVFDSDEHADQYRRLIRRAEAIIQAAAQAPN